MMDRTANDLQIHASAWRLAGHDWAKGAHVGNAGRTAQHTAFNG